MSSKQSQAPARGAKSNPRTTKTESRTPSSFEPLVGRPWPELRDEDLRWLDGEICVGVHYKSSADKIGRTRSITVGLKLKTRVFVICFFMIVAGYAAYRGDGRLMGEVVKAFMPHHDFESPP
jgi:hypothetical protein